MSEEASLRARIGSLRADDINQSLGFHSWVSDGRRYVYMAVPKVACSRIKLSLHLLEGGAEPASLGDIHEEGTRLAAYGDAEAAERLGSGDWLRFCFVRNPYDRLVSAYKTQIGNTWNDEYDWVKEEVREACAYPASARADGRLVAFRDFVRYLGDAPEQVRRDGHFNLQTNILMPDAVAYDLVGRFEDFAADFSRVLRRLDAAPEVLATASEAKNSTPFVQAALVYDRELAERVFELYRADFERYGYDRDSWMVER